MAEQIIERNAPIVAEFRANEGLVGGPFEGQPILLLHHRGRRSGAECVNPATYQSDPDDPDVMYVFGTGAGRPNEPQWCRNLIVADRAEVEVGTDRFAVTATEIIGPERDRIYARQIERIPNFADFERMTAGIRTIPVIALRRV